MTLRIMAVLTFLLSGRAMTLAFLTRVGGTNMGDPPQAWLMPLIGDALIGITALLLLYLMLRHRGLWVWTAIIVWNVVAIWDALSAYLISLTNPWPEFFMIRFFGPAMFFAASAMHLLIIILAMRREIRTYFLGEMGDSEPRHVPAAGTN